MPELTCDALIDLFVSVAVESAVSTVPLVAGNVIVVESVPPRVNVFAARSVLPLSIVRVALVAGVVIATLFTEVALATPIFGVTRVGEVDPTTAPDPVVELNAPSVS